VTMSEVEVDRITQQVFAARNSGLDAALVKVVIDEIEKATEAQAAKIARVEALADEVEQVLTFAGTPMPGRAGGVWPGRAMSTEVLARRLRAALGSDS